MGKVTKLNLEAAPVGARGRLHLRDIQDDNPEPRGSIGAELRAARLARGEDLAGVAQRLRIRRDLLEAIEGGDFDRLPGRAYSIGFVKSYAGYLGLDPQAAVAAFKAEYDAAEAPAEAALAFPVAEEETRLPRGAMLVVAALVLAGLYGIWMLTVSADRMVQERVARPSAVPQTRLPVPETAPPPPAALAPALPPAATQAAGASSAGSAPVGPASTSPGTLAGAPPAETETADAGAAAAPEAAASAAPPAAEAGGIAAPGGGAAQAAVTEQGISPLETGPERAWEGFVYGQQNHDSRIILRAHETAWVRVEDGEGNVLLSRTLRAGEAYRAPDRPGMVLATRNAGAIEILVDGASAGRAGRAGEVVSDLALDPERLSGQ